MYDATTRATYAELFKQAEARLPTAVRTETVKIAAARGEELVAALLKAKWSVP